MLMPAGMHLAQWLRMCSPSALGHVCHAMQARQLHEQHSDGRSAAAGARLPTRGACAAPIVTCWAGPQLLPHQRMHPQQ